MDNFKTIISTSYFLDHIQCITKMCFSVIKPYADVRKKADYTDSVRQLNVVTLNLAVINQSRSQRREVIKPPV